MNRKEKWNYETCYQEALRYTSRNSFKKGCGSAYTKALNKKWINDYTWFIQTIKPNGYWSYETCYQEALKASKRSDFANLCKSAYEVARINGWLDEWFPKKSKYKVVA